MTRSSTQDREAAFEHFSSLVDAPMTIISFAWLPVLIVPLVRPLHGSLAEAFNLVDYVIWALFAVEYATKLYLAPDRRGFFVHHLLDLAVVAIPMLRPLRFLRILRTIAVLGNSTRRVRSILTHRGLHFVLLFAFIIVFACAALEQYFESAAKGSNIHTYTDALWWAIVTVTTIGYGDRYPVTAGGRGVAVALMLVGIGLIGAITASVASFFVEQDSDDVRVQLTEMRAQLERIEGLIGARGDSPPPSDDGESLR